MSAVSIHRRVSAPVAALAALATAAALAIPSPPADAQSLSGRIVPEPEERALYISFVEFQDYLDELDEEYGQFMTVDTYGESVEGEPLLEVELTNPDSEIAYDDRRVVYVAQSIHGNEPGGREGMIRVIEDLLRSAAGVDPEDTEETLELLGQIRLVQALPNPDGWVSGDRLAGNVLPPGYTRENANGVDLNRQLPWRGYIAPSRRDPLVPTEPESQAMVADAEARMAAGEDVSATADIHGMLQDEAAVWTLLSSGQFDLGGIARQVAIGQRIETEVEDTLSDDAILTLAGAAGGTVVPHRLTSSSEFGGGLSGSGFYGDWMAQADGLDSASVSTIELFVNNGPAGTYGQETHVPEIVQIHVDSVRAIMRALVDMSVTDVEAHLTPPGPLGVVVDETEVEGAAPADFFDDLDPYLPAPAERLDAGEVDADALAQLAVLVVTTDTFAAAPDASDAVGTFAEEGGTVLLTDSALALLPALSDDIAGDEVTEVGTSIGNADFVDFDHPLADGVRDGDLDEALHTYEPATLGYNTESASESPVWTVERDAWEDAGGATVATTDGETSIGELDLAAGTVRVIGGLLPPPTTVNDPPFGLASYTPNDTGYQVFANALDAEFLVEEVPAELGDDEPGDDDGGPGDDDGDPGDDDGDPGDDDGDPGDDDGDPGDDDEEPGDDDGEPERHEACPDGRVPAAGFHDTAGTTHEGSVDCAAWYELATGVEDGSSYAPGRPTTREQMASFVARTLREAGVELPEPTDQGFTDLTGGPHDDAINQLAELGVISGRTETVYAPRAPIRRDQMATFLVAAFEHAEDELEREPTAFTDIDGNAHEENIEKAETAGFTRGATATTYEPEEPTLRGQMATFLTTLLDRFADEGRVVPPDRR